MADQNNIIVGAATLAIDGVDIGYTQGGVTFRKSTEYVDVDADQLGGVARKVPTFERFFVSTTLLEATRANMQKILNEPASNLGGSTLAFGEGTITSSEHVLTVVGKAPNSGTRTYTFYRAISVDDVEHVIGARDAPGMIPAGFELLKDPANKNRTGHFVDT